MRARSLTLKQNRFIAEYAIDGNAAAAARRAGYSAKTARQAGARLLSNVDVKKAIKSGQAKRSAKAGVSADWVVERLKKIVERCLRARRIDARGAVMAIEVLIRSLDPFRNGAGESPTPEPNLHGVPSEILRAYLFASRELEVAIDAAAERRRMDDAQRSIAARIEHHPSTTSSSIRA
jgi:phage terminase small subunit